MRVSPGGEFQRRHLSFAARGTGTPTPAASTLSPARAEGAEEVDKAPHGRGHVFSSCLPAPTLLIDHNAKAKNVRALRRYSPAPSSGLGLRTRPLMNSETRWKKV